MGYAFYTFCHVMKERESLEYPTELTSLREDEDYPALESTPSGGSENYCIKRREAFDGDETGRHLACPGLALTRCHQLGPLLVGLALVEGSI
ncbi:Protein of unknown function [Gryllus bimaculatus]|nr:Protein of unknown function [Gryllus bimaculatus]